MNQFDTAFRGYKKDQVDHYIQKLESQLNDYKKQTQLIANTIIQAEASSEAIISRAEKKAARIEAHSKEQLDQVKHLLEEAKMKVDSFQSNYNQLVHKYIISMNNDDFKNLHQHINSIQEDLIMQALNEGEDDLPKADEKIVRMNF